MPLAISLVWVDSSVMGVIKAGFNVTPSGSYVAGGDTLDFTSITQDATFSGLLAGIISSQAPVQLATWSQNGNLSIDYSPILGSALNNNKLKMSAVNTFGTELAAGAYPASVTGDKITGEATFKKFQ